MLVNRRVDGSSLIPHGWCESRQELGAMGRLAARRAGVRLTARRVLQQSGQAANGQAGCRPVASPLGRQTQLCLDGTLPALGSRLRTSGRNARWAALCRLCHPQGTPLCDLHGTKFI